MRNYKSTVTARTLASPITVTSGSGSTAVFLNSSANLPTYPFTLVINPDTVSEEIVTVTGAGGGAGELVVVRGQDGSTAVTHASGVAVRHMITARDLQEPQDHMNASADVHGLATAGPSSASGGSVVGTSASQTLTNKTLTSPAINTPTVTGGTFATSNLTTPILTTPAISNGTLTGTLNSSGSIIGGSVNSVTVGLAAAGSVNLGTGRTDSLRANGVDITTTEVAALSGSLSAWTAYTPALGGTGATLGTGTISGAYKTIGKTLHLRISVTYGSTTNFSSSGLTLSLPTGLFPIANSVGQCIATEITPAGRYAGHVSLTTSGTAIPLMTPATVAGESRNITTAVPISWATTDTLVISGTYEVA